MNRFTYTNCHIEIGVVVAVLGEEQDGGKFLVKDTLFLQPGIQPPLATPSEDRYTVILIYTYYTPYILLYNTVKLVLLTTLGSKKIRSTLTGGQHI